MDKTNLYSINFFSFFRSSANFDNKKNIWVKPSKKKWLKRFAFFDETEEFLSMLVWRFCVDKM